MVGMVEKAAQAAWERLAHDTHSDVPWDDPSMHDQRERMRRIASAVIEAMREPTGAMIEAGELTEGEEWAKGSNGDTVTRPYQAMIDAALAQK